MNSLQATAFLANLDPDVTKQILQEMVNTQQVYLIIEIHNHQYDDWRNMEFGPPTLHMTRSSQFDAMMKRVELHLEQNKDLYGHLEKNKYPVCICEEERLGKSCLWTRTEVINHFKQIEYTIKDGYGDTFNGSMRSLNDTKGGEGHYYIDCLLLENKSTLFEYFSNNSTDLKYAEWPYIYQIA